MKFGVLMLLISGLVMASESTPVMDYMLIHKPFENTSCYGSKTQRDMDVCTEKRLLDRKRIMKQNLQQLRKTYREEEPELQKALNKSQTSWAAFAQDSCHVETFYSRDGSGFGSIWNDCLIDKYNERISYLKWMIGNP